MMIEPSKRGKALVLIFLLKIKGFLNMGLLMGFQIEHFEQYIIAN